VGVAHVRRRGLFERPGLHLFYRLPQEEHERKMPLTLTPRAEKVVRVGLVRQPHLGPDLPQRVRALVKQFDSDDFETREKAEEQIRAIGPAALVVLSRLDLAGLPVQARRRVEGMLKGWSAKDAFDRRAERRGPACCLGKDEKGGQAPRAISPARTAGTPATRPSLPSASRTAGCGRRGAPCSGR
jgi:hypothetical protein